MKTALFILHQKTSEAGSIEINLKKEGLLLILSDLH